MALLLARRERFKTEFEWRIYPTHLLALRAIPRSAWCSAGSPRKLARIRPKMERIRAASGQSMSRCATCG